MSLEPSYEGMRKEALEKEMEANSNDTWAVRIDL